MRSGCMTVFAGNRRLSLRPDGLAGPGKSRYIHFIMSGSMQTLKFLPLAALALAGLLLRGRAR